MSYGSPNIEIIRALRGMGQGRMGANTAEITVNQIFEKCLQVGVDPWATLVVVVAGGEDPLNILHCILGCDAEHAENGSKVA